MPLWSIPIFANAKAPNLNHQTSGSWLGMYTWIIREHLKNIYAQALPEMS